MRYQITHTIAYQYSTSVRLQPHLVRLRPRSDSSQTLHNFSLSLSPTPIGRSELIELDGNSILKVWFAPQPVQQLEVKAISQVETYRTNPFDYLMESWALHLPIDYPMSQSQALQPYLGDAWVNGSDPVVAQLAQEVYAAVSGKTDLFLMELNQRIYQHCNYMTRETGDPLLPGITWSQKLGSCRDFAVLFMATCRAVGIAARFVSGYEEGDPDAPERHLHAWAEAYLPGAGWRGFDPTHGLAVSDRHIALAASPISRAAAPFVGSFQGNDVQTTMSYSLSIQLLANEP
ncbi:MAG: transglutaminase family protein [Scytolyngbya sp. HA4215-MV1]|nr:transglutaminase family protein [Scytolyngbya sp. HA4215-MV1]